MEFKDFGIKDYRSFGSDGVYLDSLKKINIFIGKNNSGKSNILRFIKRVQQVAINVDRTFSQTDYHKRNPQAPSIILRFNEKNMIEKGDPGNDEFEVSINLCTIELDYDDYFLRTYTALRRVSIELCQKKSEL